MPKSLGTPAPKPKFSEACGGSKIKVSPEFSGRFLASPKSGDVFISLPHPIIPRRVALQQSPLLFRGTALLSQMERDLSRTIFRTAVADSGDLSLRGGDFALETKAQFWYLGQA